MLIRHANSEANEAANQVLSEVKLTKYGLPLERWLQVYGNDKYIDSQLTEQGIKQCEDASEHVNKIDFRYLFVSPLRRTLETTYYTFRNHPNWKTMEIIVHPLLREKIGISGDVPLPNSQLKLALEQIYQPMFEGRLNTKLIAGRIATLGDKPWYLDSLCEQTQRDLTAFSELLQKDYT